MRQIAGWKNPLILGGLMASFCVVSEAFASTSENILTYYYRPAATASEVETNEEGGPISPAVATVMDHDYFREQKFTAEFGADFGGMKVDYWIAHVGSDKDYLPKDLEADRVEDDGSNSYTWTFHQFAELTVLNSYLSARFAYITYGYELKNGDTVVQTASDVSYEKTVKLPALTKDGYTFAGWKVRDAKIVISAEKSVTGEDLGLADVHVDGTKVTLDAQWVANSYTVKFDPNGGTCATASKKVTYDAAYGQLPVPTRAGYAFDGWRTSPTDGSSVDSETIVEATADHTLYASWEPAEYTVAFNAQGGTCGQTSLTVTFGEAYGSLPTASRTGYRSDGYWYADDNGGLKIEPSTTVTIPGNHTLYVHWQAQDYRLTVHANDGTDWAFATNVTFGAAYPTLTAPTRVGYTFVGYYTEKSGGSPVDDKTTVTTAGDHNLYAHWMANTYTVSFDANGGEGTPNPVVATFDAKYPTLPDGSSVSRSGYTFVGWFSAKSGGVEIKGGSTVVATAQDHVLYAQWEARPTHWVTFELNGGTGTAEPIEVTEGGTYGALPQDVSRTGYAFKGWWTDLSANAVQILPQSKVTLTADKTLYARWQANTYTVSFDANGGEGTPNPVSVTFDAAYPELPGETTVSRTGYTFLGWYSAATGGIEVTGEKTVVKTAGDHVLYAQWKAVGTYWVTFELNGGAGAAPDPIEVRPGDTYGTLPENVTRTGYTFRGWWTDQTTNATQVLPQSKVTLTADKTLYAHWQANTYTVSFDLNGATTGEAPDSMTVIYDATYSELPEAPTYTGYDFLGWYTKARGGTKITAESVVKIAEDHTLYAKWAGFEQEVTFDANGGSVSPESIELVYGDAYGDLPTPIRAGYAFKGWYTAREDELGTLITSETIFQQKSEQTLYAHWQANSYGVFFDVNGGISRLPLNPRIVVFGEPYGPLPTVIGTNDYHIFQGWYTASYGGDLVDEDTCVAIAKDHTLYAQWSDEEVPEYRIDGQMVGYGRVEGAGYYHRGERFTLKAVANEGSRFTYWTSGSAVYTNEEIKSIAIRDCVSNQAYRAYFELTSCLLTYDANGGACTVASASFEHGAVATDFPTADETTRTGYKLKGWSLTRTDGPIVTELTMTSDQTLYAQWEPITYKVILDNNHNHGNGGSITNPIDYGSEVTLTIDETDFEGKGNYSIFLGWSTNETATVAEQGKTLVVKNLTDEEDEEFVFYAVWGLKVGAISEALGCDNLDFTTNVYGNCSVQIVADPDDGANKCVLMKLIGAATEGSEDYSALSAAIDKENSEKWKLTFEWRPAHLASDDYRATMLYVNKGTSKSQRLEVKAENVWEEVSYGPYSMDELPDNLTIQHFCGEYQMKLPVDNDSCYIRNVRWTKAE